MRPSTPAAARLPGPPRLPLCVDGIDHRVALRNSYVHRHGGVPVPPPPGASALSAGLHALRHSTIVMRTMRFTVLSFLKSRRPRIASSSKGASPRTVPAQCLLRSVSSTCALSNRGSRRRAALYRVSCTGNSRARLSCLAPQAARWRAVGVCFVRFREVALGGALLIAPSDARDLA